MRTVTALVLCLTLSACATIIQGTSQEVSVGSNPTGAQVRVNNQTVGTTPVVLDLKRKNNHTVSISLPGYQPYEMALTRKVSGWVAGNIVFGGLIGLAVDAASGGMYKLSPSELNATFSNGSSASLENNDRLTIMIVLTADPEWEKIGQLTPVQSY